MPNAWTLLSDATEIKTNSFGGPRIYTNSQSYKTDTWAVTSEYHRQNESF